MLAAGFLFGCMGVLVKLGAGQFSSAELVFYRSAFGLLFVLPLLRSNGLTTPHWRGHLWRGLSGTVAMMLFFYCITTLPLATAITLNYTSSLFLTGLTLLAFRDKLHWPLTATLLLGFAGIVLLLHPTLERDQLIPGLLGLLSGLLAGFALFNVRQLGVLGEPAARVVFYFNLTATLFTAVWLLLDRELHAPTLATLPLLLGLGASATFAQLAMTRAYRLGATAVVSVLAYSTIAFAALFGMWLWDETLPLSGWAGMALIISSGVIALRLTPKH